MYEAVTTNIKEVSPRTLLLWYNEFDKSGYRGFKEDRRGIGKSDSFITDFNLTNQFKLYMKTTNNLGIELTMILVFLVSFSTRISIAFLLYLRWNTSTTIIRAIVNVIKFYYTAAKMKLYIASLLSAAKSGQLMELER